MDGKKISILEIYLKSFKLFKDNWLNLLLVTFIYFSLPLILYVTNPILSLSTTIDRSVLFLISIISIILSFALYSSYLYFIFKYVNGEETSFNHLLKSFKLNYFFKIVLASFLILIVIGLLSGIIGVIFQLLISYVFSSGSFLFFRNYDLVGSFSGLIFFIYFIFRFDFFRILILDKKYGFINSLNESFELTKKDSFKIFILFSSYYLINFCVYMSFYFISLNLTTNSNFIFGKFLWIIEYLIYLILFPFYALLYASIYKTLTNENQSIDEENQTQIKEENNTQNF